MKPLHFLLAPLLAVHVYGQSYGLQISPAAADQTNGVTDYVCWWAGTNNLSGDHEWFGHVVAGSSNIVAIPSSVPAGAWITCFSSVSNSVPISPFATFIQYNPATITNAPANIYPAPGIGIIKL